MSLDAITSRIREDSGADFAFILTRKGRLLTREAPPQMPEVGRATCVAAAREAVAIGAGMVERTLPREQLVPFGGAAPVDVFISPCGEAIVCVVLATWADAGAVGPALEAHIPELEALLRDGRAQRSDRKPTGRTIAPPAPAPPPDAIPPPRAASRPGATPVRSARERASSRPGGASPSAMPPPARTPGSRPRAPRSEAPASTPGTGKPPSARPRPLSGLVEMSKSGIRASDRMQDGPTIKVAPQAPRTPTPLPRQRARGPHSSEVPLGGRGSLPHIEVQEVALGRETMAAIEADGRARGSLPHIEVKEAFLGRDTMAAIDDDIDAEVRRALPSFEVGEEEMDAEALAALEQSDDGGLAPSARRRSSTPEIVVGSAILGRESLAEIDVERRLRLAEESGQPHADLRSTMPWAEDSGRPSAPPAPGHVGVARTAPAMPPRPEAAPPSTKKRKPDNSNVNMWRDALGDMLDGKAPRDPRKP